MRKLIRLPMIWWVWLLLAATAELLAAAAGVEGQGPIGLANCTNQCGDVSVPYPFGIGSGCSLTGFNLTCNTSYAPPRLFLGDSPLRVVDISLDNAIMRVQGPQGYTHMAGFLSDKMSNGTINGTWGGPSWGLTEDGPYMLSDEHNEVVLVGCHLLLELFIPDDTDDLLIINSCASACSAAISSNNEADECKKPGTISNSRCRACTGLFCCQAPILNGYTTYDWRLTNLQPHVDDFYSVHISEEGWFDFGNNTKNELNYDLVPSVLKWAIMSNVLPFNESRDGNATCPRDILGSTVCHSRHSTCTNPLSLSRLFSKYNNSYTCSCWDGYQGNPYLPDGCQDIDECTHPNNCYGNCTNTPGEYLCECPHGSIGNPRVPNGCIRTQASPASSHRPSHTGLSIGLGVGSFALLLFLFLGTTFLMRKLTTQKKKRQRERFFKQNRGQLLQQLVAHRTDIAERMIVTLEELEKATNNFDKSRELGNGGHGTVYKGILSSQHVVAIKKSKIVIQREIDQFINEVAILSQINHRNIVKLFGCCLETEVPLLVYEFISNGTLHNHLHVEAPMSISWKDRLRIAVEIAKAIAYLHSLVSMPIIHRDIKSPNILLDENLNVKLSDFGASRYVPIDQTGVDTTVQGTFGYLDPIYYSNGHLTEKSDVYSFGVVLIELLTREKPVAYRSSQGYGLVSHFVTLLSEGNLPHILDPQVAQEGAGEVVDVALLAAICVKFTSIERPTMRQVEMTLEGIYAAKDFDSSDMTDDE
ncbi:unnamed protein product [Urochloa decumbens]|uniref:Protein kinase domain-containing protein n=1 Tax=Urochloa decumbens TaxID=240449 RepID=A0ABC9DXC7_9POAL